jgi:hypothetical protein
MKNLILFYRLSVIIFLGLLSNNLIAQNVELCGKWTGVFMGQFDMIVNFEEAQNGTLTGRLQLFDKSQQIQNDLLTNFEIEGSTVRFFIPAKNTHFRAEKLKRTLNGHFIFPDNSKHSIFLVKEAPELIDNSELLQKTMTLAEANKDLIFMVEHLKKLHPSLFEFESEEAFSKRVSSAKNSFQDGMTIIEYYLKVAPVFSSIRCSHTVMRLPEKLRLELQRSGNYFPATLFFSEDKAYFISSVNENSELIPGDEIVSINDRSLTDIQNKIFDLIASEGNNISTKYYFLNKDFSDYFVLIDNSETFNLSYKRRDGSLGNAVLVSCSFEEISNTQNTLPDLEIKDFPITYLPKSAGGYSVLSIPTFACRDINRYNWFMDSVFVSLNENNIKNLVIDLRGNEGGHPLFAAQLFSYLINEPFVYFDQNNIVEELDPLYTVLQPNPIHYSGKTFVLVDGGCLSTTGHLISLLKFHNLATIIGQEPGSSYKCNDKSQQFVLPNSGIEINIPTTVFETNVEGFDRNTSVLNIEIKPDVNDVINNSDQTMESTSRIIELRNSTNL